MRELQNCMERAVALTEDHRITLQDLPSHIREFEATAFVLPLQNPLQLLSMDEVEKRYVLRVFRRYGVD